MIILTFIKVFLLVLCIALPLYHIINCLPFISRKARSYLDNEVKSNKGFSIIIPCYNEESILETAISGMQRIDYENKEVIYVNDGSSDDTFEVLFNLLDLYPLEITPTNKLNYKNIEGVYVSGKYENTIVINKVNGGKADALNAGIDYSSKEIVVTLDADSILDIKAMDIINKVFQDDDVIAAGGMVHILQGREFEEGSSVWQRMKLKNIVRFQMLEYMKGFYIIKYSLSKSRALAIISGAFGVFNKEILLEVGGYRNTVGEDIDITLRFQKYMLGHRGKKMIFAPEAICYTECPENWGDLFKQRVRWQKAFIDCIIQYRKMLLSTFFFRRVSFFFLVDAFITGTVATFLTVYWSGFVIVKSYSGSSLNLFYALVIATILMSLIYNILGVFLANHYGTKFKGMDKLRLLMTIVLDTFVFRFIGMFYTIFGTIAYFINHKDWNKVKRTGRDYALEKVS